LRAVVCSHPSIQSEVEHVTQLEADADAQKRVLDVSVGTRAQFVVRAWVVRVVADLVDVVEREPGRAYTLLFLDVVVLRGRNVRTRCAGASQYLNFLYFIFYLGGLL
jgi:hypothetical protein